MLDDDWRPKLAKIEDPIAEDFWRYTPAQGKRRTSKLAVGRPVHFPQERCWYAPVMIEGYLPKVKPVFGEGPVDALMNAMSLIKQFHDEIREIVPGSKPPKTTAKRTRRKPLGKSGASKARVPSSQASPRSNSRKK